MTESLITEDPLDRRPVRDFKFRSAFALSSRELLSGLRGLTGLNLVGADVVEVSPPYDHAEITALAAATVVYDLLTLLARRNSPR